MSHKNAPFQRVEIPNEAGDEAKVVKLEEDSKAQIKDYQFTSIQKHAGRDYSKIKSSFGPLAVTDPDRHFKSRRDSRFALNPMLKSTLTIDQEEKRALEEIVSERVERISKEAYSEAYAKGLEEGRKVGKEEASLEARKSTEALAQKFDVFLTQCETAKSDIFKENEKFLIELVYAIAKTVVLKEVKEDPEYVLRLARDLIERIGVRENIRIKVSPADHTALGTVRQGLEEKLGAMRNLTIEVSDKIQLGGCKIETEWNAINATIEQQLKAIQEGLMGREAKE